MKLLKVLSLLFALFLLSVNVSSAQNRGTNLSDAQKEELKQNLEEYALALNLSETQQSEFEAITRKYAKQMKGVKNDGGSRMSKYRKVKSIRASKNAEMKKLLSKEQYNVYLKKQKEMEKKMRERRKNNR